MSSFEGSESLLFRMHELSDSAVMRSLVSNPELVSAAMAIVKAWAPEVDSIHAAHICHKLIALTLAATED